MDDSSSASRKRNTADLNFCHNLLASGLRIGSNWSCERFKRRKSECNWRFSTCQKSAEAQAPCEYSGKKKPGFTAGLRQSLEEKISSMSIEWSIAESLLTHLEHIGKLEMDLQVLRGSTLSCGAESRMSHPKDTDIQPALPVQIVASTLAIHAHHHAHKPHPSTAARAYLLISLLGTYVVLPPHSSGVSLLQCP
jgi:hypothetical protein